MQTHPGGDAGHAKRAQPSLQGDGVGFDLAQVPPVAQAVELPAAHAHHAIAHGKPRMASADGKGPVMVEGDGHSITDDGVGDAEATAESQ